MGDVGEWFGYQREPVEVARGRRSAGQQSGFRPSRNTQEVVWIAMWVRRMCREAMGKLTTSPAAK